LPAGIANIDRQVFFSKLTLCDPEAAANIASWRLILFIFFKLTIMACHVPDREIG
jgi:hypothetical protein